MFPLFRDVEDFALYRFRHLSSQNGILAAEHPQNGVGLQVGFRFGLEAHVSQDHYASMAVGPS